jgi:hypothetical protein
MPAAAGWGNQLSAMASDLHGMVRARSELLVAVQSCLSGADRVNSFTGWSQYFSLTWSYIGPWLAKIISAQVNGPLG